MATNIPIQPSGGAPGTLFATVAAAATMEFSNDGRTVIIVKVGAAGAGNLTITSKACSHARTGDKVNAIANNGEYVFGPFPPELWNDVNEKVQLAFSVITGNTITAIKIGS